MNTSQILQVVLSIETSICLFTTIHKSSSFDPRHWSKPTGALGLSIPKEDFPRFPEENSTPGKRFRAGWFREILLEYARLQMTFYSK